MWRINLCNHFRIGFDETLDALFIYYNEIPIMRLDSNGNLEIAGTYTRMCCKVVKCYGSIC
jgi:hypothetical protein